MIGREKSNTVHFFSMILGQWLIEGQIWLGRCLCCCFAPGDPAIHERFWCVAFVMRFSRSLCWSKESSTFYSNSNSFRHPFSCQFGYPYRNGHTKHYFLAYSISRQPQLAITYPITGSLYPKPHTDGEPYLCLTDSGEAWAND